MTKEMTLKGIGLYKRYLYKTGCPYMISCESRETPKVFVMARIEPIKNKPQLRYKPDKIWYSLVRNGIKKTPAANKVMMQMKKIWITPHCFFRKNAPGRFEQSTQGPGHTSS